MDWVFLNTSFLRKNSYQISLFGPSYKDDKEQIIKRIKMLAISDLISVRDGVTKTERDILMNDAKFFIHLSRLEGQPQSVLEAMGNGCIPIVSQYCNLADIEVENLGRTIDIKQNLKNFDNAFLLQDHTTRSKNNIDYVRAQYQWKKIGPHFANKI